MASNSTRMFAQWADGVVMLKWAFFKSITKFLARKQKKNVCIDRKENCLTFAFWWIWNGFVKPSWFGKQRYWNFLLSCFFFSQICLSIRRRKKTLVTWCRHIFSFILYCIAQDLSSYQARNEIFMRNTRPDTENLISEFYATQCRNKLTRHKVQKYYHFCPIEQQ